jgi:hypothetical protein
MDGRAFIARLSKIGNPAKPRREPRYDNVDRLDMQS